MQEIAVCISNENENVTPIQTIDAIKKAGFKNAFIQWYDKEWEISQEEQLRYARECGLNIIFAHLGWQNINDIWLEDQSGNFLVERYKRDIKACKDNGIMLVVMHLTSKNMAPMYNEIGLKRIKEIADYAQRLGVTIAFENTKIRGYLEYVLDNIKNKNVGMCFDSGHYHVHFNDEFDFERVKNRIFAVHLHDNDKSDDLHLTPFEGTLDWENVLKKLKYCNYNGPITLELCYRRRYLEIGVEEFYKDGYETGEKLCEMVENLK